MISMARRSDDVMPGFDRRQHVEVITTGSSAGIGYGTGYLLAPRLVLTARHVVFGATGITIRFGLTPDGGTRSAAIAWSGAEEVDLALLTLDAPAPYEVLTPRFGELLAYPEGRRGQADTPYVSLGFPARQQGTLSSGKVYRDSVTVGGLVRSDWNLRTGLLELEVETVDGGTAEDWMGISGAPVFLHGWLIGVIVRASRHQETLTAVPLAAVLSEYRVNLGHRFAEPPPGRAKVTTLLTGHGVTPDILPARRRPYQPTLEVARQLCPQLLGRDAEVKRLHEWLSSARRYAVWRGDSWSGKTSIAVTLASEPPPGFDVVSALISRTTVSSGTIGEVLMLLADQLSALLGERPPEPGTAQIVFSELLARVFEMQLQLERSLLIILDGIDELESRDSIRRLLAMLPPDPPTGVSILLLTRPSVDFSRLADPSRPVNRPDLCDFVQLAPNVQSDQSRQRAIVAIEELLETSDAVARPLAECLAAVGPLGESELAEILGVSEEDVRHARKAGPLDRMVWTLPGERADRIVLGHATIRTTLLDRMTTPPATYQEAVAELGDRSAADGWGDGTPDFFVDGYLSMLAEMGDLRRLTDTATSPLWLSLHRRRPGAQISAGKALRQAVEIALVNNDDLTELVPLTLRLHEIQPSRRTYPEALPQALALAGYPDQARQRAEQVQGELERTRAFTRLTVVELHLDRSTRASIALELAVESARRIDVEHIDRRDAAVHQDMQQRRGILNTLNASNRQSGEPPPISAAVRKAEAMVRLAPLAHRLGRIGTEVALNAALWELILESPARDLPVRILLDAIEVAVGVRDFGHARAALDRIAASPVAADDQRRMDLLRQIVANPAGPGRIDRALEPMPVPSLSLELAEFRRMGPDNVRLHRIHTCIGRRDLHDAARLVDEFRTEPVRISDLDGPDEDLGGLALLAAHHFGSEAASLVQAVDQYVERAAAGSTTTEWMPDFRGDHVANDMLPDAAGSYLAQIVETMLRHNELETALRVLPLSKPSEVIEMIFGCYAVGAARAGRDVEAARLLRRAMYTKRNWAAIAEVSRIWTETPRWRESISLCPRRLGWADFRIEQAARTAVEAGAIQESLAILAVHQGNRAAVPAALAAAGYRNAAAVITAQIDEATPRLLTLLEIVEATHDGAREADTFQRWYGRGRTRDAPSAKALLESVLRSSDSIPPDERGRVLVRCAATATRIGQPAVADRAVKRAIELSRRLRARDRKEVMLLLVTEDVGADQAFKRHILTRLVHGRRHVTRRRARFPILVDAACAAYQAHETELADEFVEEILRVYSHRPCPTELVIAAGRHGRKDAARRLLATILTDAGPAVGMLQRQMEISFRRDYARAAAAADLWDEAVGAIRDLPLESQGAVFAGLADNVAEDNPDRARQLVIQGLLTGIGPRILAVATRLEPRVGPIALERFIHEILTMAENRVD
ncbi:trypsin-like peptidase domain-containing protein [Kribbella sp. NPDC051952]|uniref:trypsin-like peptidase domain-containing protein n=1 Tax=Kribbella sp. NPDC051952 TaxID=3154851 RepID=UPI0034135431